MTERTYSDRETIAHHEAAHAVIALDLGDGLLDVGIDLDRVDAMGGVGNVGCRLFVADLDDLNVEAEQRRLTGRIDCAGTVRAAGAASDARLRDEDPWTALRKQESDFDHMCDLLAWAHLDETPKLAEVRLRQQLDLAVQALNDPMIWRAVEIVAGAALECARLTGPEIETFVKPELEPGPST